MAADVGTAGVLITIVLAVAGTVMIPVFGWNYHGSEKPRP